MHQRDVEYEANCNEDDGEKKLDCRTQDERDEDEDQASQASQDWNNNGGLEKTW